MAAIKSIKVGETVYDLKATYDGSGNVIDQTYAESSAIPTKVSQLQNDENYLKEHQDISGLATKTELESKVDKELGKGLSEANYTETEKQKLSDIADNANNYVHPTTSGNKHIPSGGSSGQILVWKADGEAQWGTDKDTTPAKATTEADGLMSKEDKTKLNGIAANANNYTHPTGAGNKHIPAGGSSGQILKWSEVGTAVWEAEKSYSEATTGAAGLMSAADKTKLDGLKNYVLPAAGASIGGVKQGAAVTDILEPSTASTESIATSFNELLASLRAAGIIAE